MALSSTPTNKYGLDPSIEQSIMNFESDRLKDIDRLVENETADLTPPQFHKTIFRNALVESVRRSKERILNCAIAAVGLRSKQLTVFDKILAVRADLFLQRHGLNERIIATETLIKGKSGNSALHAELGEQAQYFREKLIDLNNQIMEIENWDCLKGYNLSFEDAATQSKTKEAASFYFLINLKERTAFINKKMPIEDNIIKLISSAVTSFDDLAKALQSKIKERFKAASLVIEPTAPSTAMVPVASSSSFAMVLKSNSDNVSLINASRIASAQQAMVVAQRSLALRHAAEEEAQDKALEATSAKMTGIMDQNLKLQEQLKVEAAAAQQVRANEKDVEGKLQSEIAALEKSIRDVQATITHYATANAQVAQAIQQTNTSNGSVAANIQNLKSKINSINSLLSRSHSEHGGGRD